MKHASAAHHSVQRFGSAVFISLRRINSTPEPAGRETSPHGADRSRESVQTDECPSTCSGCLKTKSMPSFRAPNWPSTMEVLLEIRLSPRADVTTRPKARPDRGGRRMPRVLRAIPAGIASESRSASTIGRAVHDWPSCQRTSALCGSSWPGQTFVGRRDGPACRPLLLRSVLHTGHVTDGANRIRAISRSPVSQERRYQFVPGPLFSNIACVDDLHRAPAKSLAVLVDSMRRRQVGYGRAVEDLPTPFVLIATVPPTSEDSDWALAEAVTDRFLLEVRFEYPSESEEWEIGRQANAATDRINEPLISAGKLTEFQAAAANVEMADEVLGYAWALTRATRPGNELAPDFVETWIRLGISPQGLVALISAAKARALLRGRTSSTRRDVYEVAQPVFLHRLRGNDEAMAAGLTVDRLISMLLERVSPDGEYRPQQD